MRKLKHILWHSFWTRSLRGRHIKLWREKKQELLTLRQTEAARNKVKLLRGFIEQGLVFSERLEAVDHVMKAYIAYRQPELLSDQLFAELKSAINLFRDAAIEALNTKTFDEEKIVRLSNRAEWVLCKAERRLGIKPKASVIASL